MLYMVMIRQAAFICLADTSEQDTKYQYEKTYRTVDELQQSMERIHYYVNDIMDGFDKQKEEVVKNSGYMTQIDEEFKKIVDAVLNNKEIVDELEKIISQFKI